MWESCISFLSEELFDKLAAAHPDWPHMTGAVGSANMWGLDEEPKWKVMRVDRVQYGPLFLTNVPVVDFPKDRMDFFEKRAGMPTAGLIGSNVLLNYRVGLDYAHSTVYFEFGRTFNFPDFDVIGLTLRPEDDGRFTILGVADFDGKPSVPPGADGVQAGDHLVAVDDIPVRGSTMGQVWAMLGGTPGQERSLTIERAGKEFAVVAKVQHFLAELPDEKDARKRNSRSSASLRQRRAVVAREHFLFQRRGRGRVEALADENRIALLLDHDRAVFGGPGVAAFQQIDFGLGRLLRAAWFGRGIA